MSQETCHRRHTATAGRGASAAAIDPWATGGWELPPYDARQRSGKVGLVSERVPHLHVCITCRAGRELSEGEIPPGKLFHDIVAALAEQRGGVVVREVTCLSLCKQGCAAVISAPGKWGYLLGGLTDAHAADLLTYGGLYAAAKTGTIMPSKRPASLEQAVRARFPALELL